MAVYNRFIQRCRASFSCLTAVRVRWKPGKCQAVRPPGSRPASEPWQEHLGPRRRRGERRQTAFPLSLGTRTSGHLPPRESGALGGENES